MNINDPYQGAALLTFLQQFFSYACGVIALLSLILALFVLSKGRRKTINVLWSLMCLAVAFWAFGIGMMVRSKSFSDALFWQTWFLYLGAGFIPVIFFHFVTLITGIPRRRFLVLGYGVALMEQALNLTGHLATVAPKPPFAFYTEPFPVYASYFVFFLIWATYAHWLLLKKILASQGQVKEQMKYIAIGTFIGFCGGATTFAMTFGIPLFPYGVYLVPVYTLTVTYAIFKHQLMDINVVIRKTLLYSLVSAALAAVYVGTITILAQLLGGRHGSVTAFSSAMAAIFITLLFNPLRVRIQRFVDRYFFREAMDQAILREATSGFVHEIKRPLANISLPTELSLADLQDLKDGRRSIKEVVPKIEQRLQYILNQTADAGNKIEAIREFSISDAKPGEDVDVKEIIQKCVMAEKPILSRHRIDLELAIADNLPLVRGHAKQLEIVFSNLIKNAADAMGKSNGNSARSLWIDAHYTDGMILISVKDSGPGIKPEVRPHLFQPYFTTKGAHGMGMGLYLCRQIVQAHGGTIKLQEGSEIGAEFILSMAVNSK